MTVAAFVVYVHEPVRNMWLFKHRFTDRSDADEYAEMYRWKGRRSRVAAVSAAGSRVWVKPPVHNAARSHRETQAGHMCVLADACKRYKTPG